MKCSIRPGSWFVGAVVLASTASRSPAQSFNVDLGSASTPSPAFGAAAGQAGQWNVFQFGALPSTALPALDLQGQPTAVLMTQTNGRVETCDQATYGGDVGALLDDHQTNGFVSLNDPAIWEISGMEPGNYELYLYVATRCLRTTVRFEFLSGATGSITATPGDYLGAWVEGVTHLRIAFTQLPGTSTSFQLRHIGPSFDNPILSGFQLDRIDALSQPFCAGDGTLIDHTTPCPCGNNGAPGHGCAHSANPSGALLSATGTTAADDVTLIATSLPSTSYTQFLQHSALGDMPFHDGVICGGGQLIRLRGRSAQAGQASFPNPAFPNDAMLTLSARGQVAPGLGVRRYYSAWFRNPSSTFCPPGTANTTNGWILDW